MRATSLWAKTSRDIRFETKNQIKMLVITTSENTAYDPKSTPNGGLKIPPVSLSTVLMNFNAKSSFWWSNGSISAYIYMNYWSNQIAASLSCGQILYLNEWQHKTLRWCPGHRRPFDKTINVASDQCAAMKYSSVCPKAHLWLCDVVMHKSDAN